MNSEHELDIDLILTSDALDSYVFPKVMELLCRYGSIHQIKTTALDYNEVVVIPDCCDLLGELDKSKIHIGWKVGLVNLKITEKDLVKFKQELVISKVVHNDVHECKSPILFGYLILLPNKVSALVWRNLFQTNVEAHAIGVRAISDCDCENRTTTVHKYCVSTNKIMTDLWDLPRGFYKLILTEPMYDDNSSTNNAINIYLPNNTVLHWSSQGESLLHDGNIVIAKLK